MRSCYTCGFGHKQNTASQIFFIQVSLAAEENEGEILGTWA